jgi:hypothetical protein
MLKPPYNDHMMFEQGMMDELDTAKNHQIQSGMAMSAQSRAISGDARAWHRAGFYRTLLGQ